MAMREIVIDEVQRLLRDNVSPHDLLREVQKVPYAFVGLDKERDPNDYGVKTTSLVVDRQMISVDGTNAPIYVVQRIYFKIPGIRVYSSRNPMMGRGGNYPNYSIEGHVDDMTLLHSPTYDGEGNPVNTFQVIGGNYAIDNFRFRN